jgi:hypothetical protein
MRDACTQASRLKEHLSFRAQRDDSPKRIIPRVEEPAVPNHEQTRPPPQVSGPLPVPPPRILATRKGTTRVSHGIPPNTSSRAPRQSNGLRDRASRIASGDAWQSQNEFRSTRVSRGRRRKADSSWLALLARRNDNAWECGVSYFLRAIVVMLSIKITGDRTYDHRRYRRGSSNMAASSL